MSDAPHDAQILRDAARMTADDTLTFRCGADLECFTRCCSDVSIVLTPYDVVRLSRALGIETTEFLDRYTISPFTKEQKIPVVLLKMGGETRRCPFVGDAGCQVYGARPWACRMYPLGAAEPRQPTPTDRAFYFVLHEDQCLGHGQGPTFTIREWIRDEGIEQYEAMSSSFKSLMLHEFWDRDEPLSLQQMEMYHTACYDLDRFRRFVLESTFLDRFEVDETRVEAIRTDDEELIEFAMQWLRFCLFGERTMRMKPSAEEKARAAARPPAGPGTPGAPQEGFGRP